MGRIFDNIKKVLTQDVKKFSPFVSMSNLYPMSHFTNYNSFLRAATQISWVYKAVSIVGESIAMVPGFIYDDEENEILTNKILNQMFKRPNEFMTWFEMKEGIVWHLDLTGNVYLLKDEYNALGQPTKIYLLRPDKMEVVPSSTKFIAGYQYDVDGNKIPFKREDIIHIKLPNPISDLVGMGKIEASQITYNTEIAASTYNWKFFENGASPSAILTNEASMNEDSYNRLVKLFQKRQTGFMRMQRPMLLEQGTQYKQMGLSQQDMAFMEQRKFSQQEILSIFGVPPAKAGIMEYASYANVKEQENTYRKDTLKPLLIRIQQKLTNELVALFDPSWQFEFEEVVTRDEEIYLKMAREGVAGGLLTPNEARELYLELPYVEKEDSMNSFYMPFNVSPITGEIAETVAQVAPAVEKPEEKPEDEDEDKSIKKCAHTKKLNEQDALLKISLSTRKRMSRKIKDASKAFFKKQGKRINSELEGVTVDKLPSILYNADELKEFKKEMISAEMPIFVAAYNNIVEVFGKGKSMTLDEIQKKLLEDNPELQKILGKLGRRVTNINETTIDQLDKTLTEGIDAGEGIPDLQKRVNRVVSDRASWQAIRIARTESAFAYDGGAVLGYKEVGVPRLDVIGCTEIEPDWDCGAMGVPVDEAGSLQFHPNHVGTFVPSDI